MAQFRRNHSGQRGGVQIAFRFFILLGLLVMGLLWWAPQWLNRVTVENVIDNSEIFTVRTYLPSSMGEVVHHKYFALSYKEEHEQPEWTAHVLKKEMVDNKDFYRNTFFYEDPKVSTKSATHYDYRGSGYERGHLVPAGDMRFDSIAMMETFYMSNMSPMVRGFNNGIWRELEIQIRNWTYRTDSLYVISGPIFQSPLGQIGQKNKITVPSAFFKVVLDYHFIRPKVVAFIIPNALSDIHLKEYIVPVSEVESMTGLRFFPELLTAEDRSKLWRVVQPSQWPLSEKHFELRVGEWNRE